MSLVRRRAYRRWWIHSLFRAERSGLEAAAGQIPGPERLDVPR